MDRGNKKRSSPSDPSKRGCKKRKTDQTLEIAAAPTVDPLAVVDEQHRPLSIFEFPWQKESAIDGDHGCDLRDVFFSSLVDGCKAAIGFPGDRLSPSPAPILLPDEIDGVDCIWSCALSEPLSLRCVR